MKSFILEIAKRQRFDTVDDFYAAIGYGGILLSKIMPRVKEDYNKLQKSLTPVNVEEIIASKKPAKSPEGVIIEGMDNCLIKLSRCCAPLPGDQIIGFITRGHGVSVHKLDCSNVPRDINNCSEPQRWVPARWATNAGTSFTSTLQINCIDREGLLLDVTTSLYNMHVPIHNINARSTKDGNGIITVTVTVENKTHLQSIIAHMGKLLGVFSVERKGV